MTSASCTSTSSIHLRSLFHPLCGWNLELLRLSCRPPTASRKRTLYVAIGRCSRSVHLAVKDDETERSAIAFLHEAAAAFPFRLTHVLTDTGSCFTPVFAKPAPIWWEHSIANPKPRTPQTNGMVERFNGRIGSEVLNINITSHRALEQRLRGFNAAYNTRRQRVLDGKTPDQIVAEQLKATPALAKTKPQGRAGPCDTTKARLIAEAAKEVSQPDKPRSARHHRLVRPALVG